MGNASLTSADSEVWRIPGTSLLRVALRDPGASPPRVILGFRRLRILLLIVRTQSVGGSTPGWDGSWTPPEESLQDSRNNIKVRLSHCAPGSALLAPRSWLRALGSALLAPRSWFRALGSALLALRSVSPPSCRIACYPGASPPSDSSAYCPISFCRRLHPRLGWVLDSSGGIPSGFKEQHQGAPFAPRSSLRALRSHGKFTYIEREIYPRKPVVMNY